MINNYVALDLETSGLNPPSDKIIEIGMAKIVDGEITEEYKTLVNPGVHLNARITSLTGISDDMLKGQPYIEDLIEDILQFIGELPLLGHNIIFDYSFLKKAAVNAKKTFEKEGIDTLKMARRLLPEVEHKNLDYLCAYFHIDAGNSHRAYDDAISAKQLYEKLYEVKPEDEGFTKTIPLLFQPKKDSPITPAQKNYLTSLIAMYQIDFKDDIDKLSKSRASKLIDGILSEYGIHKK